MIDKLMKKYGYNKIGEDEYGVIYEKREPQNYDHVVCVMHKASGRHIMQSYDKEVLKVPGRTWGVCDSVGVEIPVLLLMWLKAKYLCVKYKWGKCNAK